MRSDRGDKRKGGRRREIWKEVGEGGLRELVIERGKENKERMRVR